MLIEIDEDIVDFVKEHLCQNPKDEVQVEETVSTLVNDVMNSYMIEYTPTRRPNQRIEKELGHFADMLSSASG